MRLRLHLIPLIFQFIATISQAQSECLPLPSPTTAFSIEYENDHTILRNETSTYNIETTSNPLTYGIRTSQQQADSTLLATLLGVPSSPTYAVAPQSTAMRDQFTDLFSFGLLPIETFISTRDSAFFQDRLTLPNSDHWLNQSTKTVEIYGFSILQAPDNPETRYYFFGARPVQSLSHGWLIYGLTVNWTSTPTTSNAIQKSPRILCLKIVEGIF